MAAALAHTRKRINKESGEMELAMKEGYKANYGFIKESNKEWDFTSGDGISLPPAFGFRLNPD